MVWPEAAGCEDLRGGMTIVIRLKSVDLEIGIVKGVAGTRELDTFIQHFFEADGYVFGEVLFLCQ